MLNVLIKDKLQQNYQMASITAMIEDSLNLLVLQFWHE